MGLPSRRVDISKLKDKSSRSLRTASSAARTVRPGGWSGPQGEAADALGPGTATRQKKRCCLV